MSSKPITENKVENDVKTQSNDESVETQNEVKASSANDIPESESANYNSEISRGAVPWHVGFNLRWTLIGLVVITDILLLKLFLLDEYYIYVIGTLIGLNVGLLLWYLPKWQVKKLADNSSDNKLTEFEREKERLKLEDDTRKTLAQIIGGVFLIVGLFVTYNTYRLGIDNYLLGLEQQKINSRGQITERFNRAVEHLGNDNLSVRLGGLYALEQILKDSPEERRTIIEVISAYIRDKSNKDDEYQNEIDPVNSNSNVNSQTNSMELSTKPRILMTDAQTALTILIRWQGNGGTLYDADLQQTNLSYIDLRKANLNGVKFRKANLKRAVLSGASFVEADFSNADLSETNLSKINLSKANLSEANLQRAIFEDAILEDADLSGADLKGADFKDAKIRNANLNNVSLNNLSSFNYGQLESARFDFMIVRDKKLSREEVLRQARNRYY